MFLIKVMHYDGKAGIARRKFELRIVMDVVRYDVILFHRIVQKGATQYKSSS